MHKLLAAFAVMVTSIIAAPIVPTVVGMALVPVFMASCLTLIWYGITS